MISLTPAAKNHLERSIENRRRKLKERKDIMTSVVFLDVVNSGCSGYAYKFEFLDIPDDGQKQIELFKTKDVLFKFEHFAGLLMLSQRANLMLEGSTIDFVREGLNEGLQINNPNEKSKCGCGESFQV